MLIETRTSQDPLVRAMATAQQAELAGIEGPGHISFPLGQQIEYVVGLLDGEVVACGAVQALEPDVGEVKRMYVLPAFRGRGLSRQILAAVEALAAQRGFRTLRLETGTTLEPALGLYTSSGYVEIPLFGQYVGHATSVCFEKRL